MRRNLMMTWRSSYEQRRKKNRLVRKDQQGIVVTLQATCKIVHRGEECTLVATCYCQLSFHLATNGPSGLMVLPTLLYWGGQGWLLLQNYPMVCMLENRVQCIAKGTPFKFFKTKWTYFSFVLQTINTCNSGLNYKVIATYLAIGRIKSRRKSRKLLLKT